MGIFITFEGIDGSGKTTQVGRFQGWLSDNGFTVHVAREPGGTPLGRAIRQLLLNPEWREMHARTEFLLFSASRAQLVEEEIKPRLEGLQSIVICDRYVDSSAAYQGGGRGLNVELVEAVSEFATNGLMPDLTFYLDIDWRTSIHRLRHEVPDRMKDNPKQFFERVRNAYLELCERYPERIVTIDARKSEDDVFEQIREEFQQRLA